MIERILIDTTLVFVALGMGYWIGFRACYDYLSEEVKKARQNEKSRTHESGREEGSSYF